MTSCHTDSTKVNTNTVTDQHTLAAKGFVCGYYGVQGHSRSSRSVPIKSQYAISY